MAMPSFQVIRNGFPDRRFFGNSFVALSLAKKIDDSTLLAQTKPNLVDEALWIDLAKTSLGVELRYSPYLNCARKTQLKGDSLVDIVRKQLDTSDSPVIMDFHFPETDMQADVISRLPEEFGKDVKQYMHLHCSSDFFFKNTKARDNRIADIKHALDAGLIDRFIPVSYNVRDSFLDHIPREKMTVVRNGIDEDIYSFRPERDKDAFKAQFSLEGKFVIGYSGRLDTIKGYDNLLKIMKWFDSHPEFDVGFLMASPGGGRMKHLDKDLEKHCERLISENRVGVVLDVAKYVGGRKDLNSDVYAYFNDMAQSLTIRDTGFYRGITPVPLQAMSDVYLQPSVSEGLPLSVIESVFVGTPVVASRVGGLSEIVTEAGGSLVDYSSKARVRIPDFCDAIIYQIEQNYSIDGSTDSSLFREELRQRLIPLFGDTHMAEKTRRVYTSR